MMRVHRIIPAAALVTAVTILPAVPAGAADTSAPCTSPDSINCTWSATNVRRGDGLFCQDSAAGAVCHYWWPFINPTVGAAAAPASAFTWNGVDARAFARLERRVARLRARVHQLRRHVRRLRGDERREAR